MTFEQQTQLYKGSSLHAFDGTGYFTFYFEGTSVAFTGIMRNSLLEPPPTVQIDNGTVFNVTYAFPNTPQAYYQWFQSPVLSDGNHTAVVACPEGAYVDFAIVRVNVGNETRLAGTTVIVDSDSPSIIYSGNWSRNTSQLDLTSSSLVAYPYGNSTYSSSTPGDTFTFRFTGTSCSIYGASFRSQENAALDATYTIDGTTKNSTYYTYNRGDDINYLYYSLENLSAGNHTLIVNITAASGQAFTLDYITYAFGSSSLPLSNSTPLSSTSLGNPSAQPSRVQNPGTIRPSPTAAIVGGVIGVASGLIVILGLWLFLRRRRANQLETDNTYQFVYTPDEHNYQNGANNPQQIIHHNYHQPVKFRTLDPVVQATGSHLPPGPSSDPPPNTDDPAAENAIDPPPYDALSCACPVTAVCPEDTFPSSVKP